MRSAHPPSCFSLDISGSRFELAVLTFRGEEALNTTYRFVIDCINERSELDLDALLHQ